MNVEILYIADCPSHPRVVKLVREVLATVGVAAEIREVLVRDEAMAGQLRFYGSPTIRINGRDVGSEFQKTQTFALSCRLYPGSNQVGLPTAEMIRIALLGARQGDRP